MFATAHGMAVQLNGLRQRVDPHYRRGLSYLKIGLRGLKGVWHKGRDLFACHSSRWALYPSLYF